MGLLKGRTGFLGRSRRSIAELQQIGRKATESSLQTFSRLAGEAVAVGDPRVSLVPRDRIADVLRSREPMGIAARFPFHGSGAGVVATFFDEKNALRLVELLLGQEPGQVKKMGELEESAIAEMTNIVLNGAITAIAEAEGLHFETGVPEVARRVKDHAAFLVFDAPAEVDHAVLVETPFRETSRDVEGSLVLVFGVQALRE